MRFRHSCTLHPRPSATVPDDPSSSLVALLQAVFDVIEDRMLRVGHITTGQFIWRALNETIVKIPVDIRWKEFPMRCQNETLFVGTGSPTRNSRGRHGRSVNEVLPGEKDGA